MKKPTNNEDNSWIEDITPEQAKAYLTKNRKNRPVQPATVDRFVEQMKSGQWLCTHQGIAFDKDGFLLDGQHRLHAIVKSGCTIRMRVTIDLPPEAMAVLDTGMKRTQGQILHMRGQQYASFWAALCNSLQKLITRSNRVPLSVFDMERILTEEADMVALSGPHFVDTAMRTSWLSAPLFLAMRKDPAKVTAFISAYSSGVNLQEGDPAHGLRKLFIEGRGSRSYLPREKSLRVLSALRHHLQGTRVAHTHIYALETGVDYFASAHINATNKEGSPTLIAELCKARLAEPSEEESETPKPPRPKKGVVR